MECESIPEKLKQVLLSTEEFEARLATAQQTPGRMSVLMYENEQGELYFPPPSPVVQMGNLDLAGRLRPNITNAAGEGTEENSAAIQTSTEFVVDLLSQQHPMFGTKSTTTGGPTQAQARIMFVPAVCDGAGQLPATALVAALPDYQSCARLTHIHSDQTDAAGILAFSAISGLASGLATITIATVANTVAPDFGPGLYWQTDADNENITIEAAAGQFGANQVLTFIGEYWYET